MLPRCGPQWSDLRSLSSSCSSVISVSSSATARLQSLLRLLHLLLSRRDRTAETDTTEFYVKRLHAGLSFGRKRNLVTSCSSLILLLPLRLVRFSDRFGKSMAQF